MYLRIQAPRCMLDLMIHNIPYITESKSQCEVLLSVPSLLL